MRTLIILAMLAPALAGCSTWAGDYDVPKSDKIVGPAKFAMATVPAVPVIKAGDDLAVDNAKVRRQLGDRNDQVRTLQKWVRRVCNGQCAR